MDRGPFRRRARRLAVLLAPLLALGLAELALRVVGWEPRPAARYDFLNPEWEEAGDEGSELIVADEQLFWRLRPGARAFGGSLAVDEASGYRTPPFDVDPSPQRTRIVCIGDSITFGFGVDLDESWPRVLAERLGDSYEVVSTGVPGYTSHQGRLVLSEALEWRPDVVVIAFGAFNDWVPAMELPDSELAEFRSSGIRVYDLVRATVRSARAAAARAALPEDRDLRRLDTRGFGGLRRVPLASFEANLLHMVERVVASGASPVLVALPLPPETVERNPVAEEYAGIVQRVAGATQTPLADSWSDFRRLRLDRAFLDFCHPNPVGHARVAEIVAEAVVGEGNRAR